jgi:diguanylate cyclase (GGDEF)-like protein
VAVDDLPCAVVRVDASGIVADANVVFSDWTGRPLDELVGRRLDSLLRASKSPTTDGSVLRLTGADGHRRAVMAARSSLPDGELLVLVDATERMAFEDRLTRSRSLEERTRNRLELVIEASIAFATATTENELADILATTVARAYGAEESAVFLLNDAGMFEQASGSNPLEGTIALTALAPQASMLRHVVKVSGADQAEQLSPALGRAFRELGVYAMLTAPIRHDDELFGLWVCFFLHPRTFDAEASPLAEALSGQAGQTATSLRLQRQLEHAAMHDETTGLANRRFLETLLPDYTRAPATLMAVLFIDLDGFKAVNDSLGHHAGDLLLREVGARLKGVVRHEDLVARYGGDEFVVVCEVPDSVAAHDVAERIRQEVRRPFDDLPEGFPVSASIGLSIARTEASAWNPDLLIRLADQAMYTAKNAGGDRIVDARGFGGADTALPVGA